ncbi:hypothetical protein J4Q44_G00353870 [Coregonus suidteri]|uniref:Uncharacterized protein n=1 Tax=Coregonus suidteri TaxID=861788 RepID=A0AAN8KLE2_9TELE
MSSSQDTNVRWMKSLAPAEDLGEGQGLAISTQHRLAAAHVGHRQAEVAAQLRRLVVDVA